MRHIFYAVENQLFSKEVEDNYEVQIGEIAYNDYPTTEQLGNDFTFYRDIDIKIKINALESEITNRRLREAILGTQQIITLDDDTTIGWLENQQNKIKELRDQLEQ